MTTSEVLGIKIRYSGNKENGIHRTYWNTGELYQEYSVKNGQNHGLYKSFYDRFLYCEFLVIKAQRHGLNIEEQHNNNYEFRTK